MSTTGSRRLFLLLLIGLSVLSLLLAGAATAAPGDLRYAGCIGQNVIATGSTTCTNIQPHGSMSGPIDVATTSIGASGQNDIYVLSWLAGITHYRADPNTGDMRFAGCYAPASRASSLGCNSTGSDEVLSVGRSIVVSPDGLNLYTAAETPGVITRFNRNITTGRLTFMRCYGRQAGCLDISAAPGVLDGVDALDVSRDGQSLVFSSQGANAVGLFFREGDGSLGFAGCDSENLSGCGQLNAISHSALQIPADVQLSPNGRYVYVAAYGSNAIARFSVSRTGRPLTFAGCWASGEGSLGSPPARGCTATPAGTLTGARTLALSARQIYVGGELGNVVSHFNIGSDGSPSYRDCVGHGVTGCSGTAAADSLRGVNAIAVDIAPEPSQLYVLGQQSQALSVISLNQTDGTMTFRNCLARDDSAHCTQVGRPEPLNVPTALTFDWSNHLYVTAWGGNAVSNFVRASGPPACLDSSAVASDDRPITITFNCYHSTPVTSYTVHATPSHGRLGTVDTTRGTVTYTAERGYTGDDSFTFSSSDSEGASSVTRVSIRVASSILPPAPPPPPPPFVVDPPVPPTAQQTQAGATRPAGGATTQAKSLTPKQPVGSGTAVAKKGKGAGSAHIRFVSKRLRATRKGKVTVRLSCLGGSNTRCRGILVAAGLKRKGGKVTVGSRNYRVTAGRTVSVVLKLPKQVKKLIRHGRSLSVLMGLFSDDGLDVKQQKLKLKGAR